MSDIIDPIRRIIYGVPSDPAKRAQIVRDEIVEGAEQQSWEWEIVRDRAKTAYVQLKNEQLPEEGDEIETFISNICKKYSSKGYTIEDLEKGMDGAQVRASSKQQNA